MIVLRLPIPPSVNSSTFNVRGKGRRKTKKYRDWLQQADRWMLMQKPLGQIRGKCQMCIKVPPTRCDVSNLIKAAEDYCVSREITGDDKNNRRVSIEVDESLDCCEITIIKL